MTLHSKEHVWNRYAMVQAYNESLDLAYADSSRPRARAARHVITLSHCHAWFTHAGYSN